MIGLGKWRGSVKSKFFTGDVDFEVSDKNGKYEFNIDLPEKFRGIDYEYYDISESGDTLTCKGRCSALPMFVINAELKFSGDNAVIKLSTPLMLKSIKINAVRIDR